MIVAVTVFQAFLWTMPWPGFGQRYDSVTTHVRQCDGCAAVVGTGVTT